MVQNHQPEKTYDYYGYSLVAPLWFGVWNIISSYLSKNYNLTKQSSLFMVSILSYLTVISFARNSDMYNKTQKEWNFYYFQQFMKYMIIWNLVIYNLDKYIS